MPLHVKLDDKDMRRFVRTMPQAGNRSVARALNKAITQTKTRAGREIAAKRNIAVGRANKDMRLYKATPSRLTASIYASGQPIPLYEVKGSKRQTARGVVARVEAKAAPHLFEGAFVATMPSGHVGVFMRSKTKRMQEKKKAAVFEIKLPSVSATMVQDAVEPKLRAFAIPVYEAELERLLVLEMRKAGAR